jgi:hypothetical protein
VAPCRAAIVSGILTSGLVFHVATGHVAPHGDSWPLFAFSVLLRAAVAGGFILAIGWALERFRAFQ